ncbi:MAG: zinc-dependent metalloprotease family protein [Bacteroidales bacterium]
MRRVIIIISTFIIFLIFILYSCNNGSKRKKFQNKTQTVNKMQAVKKVEAVKKKIIVGILPLGEFDQNLITIVKANIANYYQVNVIELPMQALPQTAYLISRDRYIADSLLEFILNQKAFQEKNISSTYCNYIVGLTSKDICTSHNNSSSWGVFGLGFMPGKACIISTLRLKKNVDFSLLTERLIKVVLHELGHNFGLDHCTTPNCMMRDAEGTIKSVDNEKMDICDVCKRKLKNK